MDEEYNGSNVRADPGQRVFREGLVSPTVWQRRLAHELRRLREGAMLTCEEVAERLDCSASKISRVETGRVSASARDVRDMLAIYGVPEEQRGSLVQLARECRRKGWWHAFGDSVQPGWAAYLGLECAASEIRIYKVNGVPGLLQTGDYARAMLTAGSLGRPGPGDDRSVALTLERQRQALASRPKLWVVVDEAALRRLVGGEHVIRDQIEHLIVQSSMPNVCIQVVPFTSGAYVTMHVPFTILAFPDRADPDTAWVGYPTGTLWIEDAGEVGHYHGFFRHLQAAALSPDDSLALMASLLTDPQPPPPT